MKFGALYGVVIARRQSGINQAMKGWKILRLRIWAIRSIVTCSVHDVVGIATLAVSGLLYRHFVNVGRSSKDVTYALREASRLHHVEVIRALHFCTVALAFHHTLVSSSYSHHLLNNNMNRT